MIITEKLVEFLKQLLIRHDDMSTDLKTILAKLTDQGEQIADQGKEIDSLIAARDAQEQADLDQIASLIDANSTASAANAAKLVAAVAPASTSSTSATDPAPATDPATASAATTVDDTTKMAIQ